MTDPLPTEHPELTVRVEPLPVRMTDLEGGSFDTEIFLHEDSDRHPGPETLTDRLNDPANRFLPCRIDGEVQLVHLDRLAWVERDGRPPEVVELQEMEPVRTAVELELAFGDGVRGDLLYLLPEARSRPSDALNRAETSFLLLLAPDTTRYVHRDAVVRVRFL